MRNLSPSQTVAACKAAYPYVGRSCDGAQFCVGGAFADFVGFSAAPHITLSDLSIALYYHNPALMHGDAMRHAAMIISHNDCGRIDQAWQQLEQALGG